MTEELEDQVKEACRVIDSIRLEHSLIKDRMGLLLDKKIPSTEWEKDYDSFRSLLLTHIEKEDTYLYPYLEEKAKNSLISPQF